MNDNQVITDWSDLKKYRTELPNLYDDAELDPYEFRLLAHYKRVGTCTESAQTTADKCRMSKPQVIEIRQSLAEKKFIKLTKKPCPGGFAYSIEVVDLWLENFAKYSGLSKVEITERLNMGSQHDPQGSQGTLKEVTTTSIFSIYESNIGILTPMIADTLQDAEKIYPLDWIVESINLAVENNKRNWRYCETILKRWQANGKDNGKKAPSVTVSEFTTL